MPNGTKAWETRRARYGANGASVNLQEVKAKGDATRKALYGPSGMTPEARARKAEEAKALGHRNRKDTCKYGHPWTAENTRYDTCTVKGKEYQARRCRMCESIRSAKRSGYDTPLPPIGLVPAGITLQELRSRRSWLRRRLEYGDSGISPEDAVATREKALVASLAAAKAAQKRTHCKRGHLFPKQRNAKGHRHCQQCEDLQTRGRPRWIDVPGARVSIEAHDDYFMSRFKVLRAFKIATHPDKPGGTSRKFRDASKALSAFLNAERTWYAQYGLKLPAGDLSAREPVVNRGTNEEKKPKLSGKWQSARVRRRDDSRGRSSRAGTVVSNGSDVSVSGIGSIERTEPSDLHMDRG